MQDVKAAIANALASAAFLETLAAVDAEKGISTTNPTPGPEQVLKGEKFLLMDQGFPVVEVIGIRSVYQTAAEQLKAVTHEIHIMWTHIGDDELAIAAQLERLVRATRDYFWPLQGLDGLQNVNGGPIEIVSEDYTPLAPSKKLAFVKGAFLVLRVPTLTV